ncbi:probable myosin light chain kinase DDB_G0292624 [Oscarella lobularis]|uniref:probable myosin light chain kinase DDB_G0292624 n=1 Tax=Oscarella lobularis TaxID=121494 RepID=UPI0033143611
MSVALKIDRNDVTSKYKKATVAAKVVTIQSNSVKEAEILAVLNHPNIVRFFGYVDHADGIILITELVPGSSLGKLLIDYSKALPQSKKKSIAQEICVELAYTHGMKIIHFDVKPSNILSLKKNAIEDFVVIAT